MNPRNILEIMDGVMLVMAPAIKSEFAEIDRKFGEHKFAVVKNPWFKGIRIKEVTNVKPHTHKKKA